MNTQATKILSTQDIVPCPKPRQINLCAHIRTTRKVPKIDCLVYDSRLSQIEKNSLIISQVPNIVGDFDTPSLFSDKTIETLVPPQFFAEYSYFSPARRAIARVFYTVAKKLDSEIAQKAYSLTLTKTRKG